MIGPVQESGSALAALLAEIAQAEAAARDHDRAHADRDHHAAAAQRADERAEAARHAARAMIERAFPGVKWPMIERATL